jgi:nucleoside diphosphate kinase
MAVELSYVLITPYSLTKSRTGGIIARLLSRTDLDLVGAQFLTFTKELVAQYSASLEKTVGASNPKFAKLLSDYVKENFSERENGKRERVMMLLFRGEDACKKLYEIAGSLSGKNRKDSQTGETIRDTYADLVADKDNPDKVRYFEPAVLTPPDFASAAERLKMFAGYRQKQNAENVVGVEGTSARW